MKSPTLELQDDQKFALMKFKRNVRDILKPEHDDHHLLRWIMARKWNVEAAEKMFRESIKWRESMNIDEIADWEPPHDFSEYYSYGFMGFTSRGHPLAIVPVAELDMMGFMKTLTKDEIVKVSSKIVEHHIKIAYDSTKLYGYNARKFIVIVDLANFSVRQYLTKQVLDIAIHLAKLYELNYPCILQKVFIINAPGLFTVVFNILKKFLSPETIGSVKIMNTDKKKWEKALLEVIDAEILPKCYGGTMVDENGDERCPHMIKYPKRKIPTSWYMNSKQQNDADIMESDMNKIENELKAVILDAEA